MINKVFFYKSAVFYYRNEFPTRCIERQTHREQRVEQG